MAVVAAGGNFFLGMDNTPSYTRDVSNMRLVIRRDGLSQIIAPMILRLTNEVIAKHAGKIDMVKDISAVVPARFVKEYMGVAGPGENNLIEETTYLFEYLFYPANPFNQLHIQT
ncbi:hypothetical protein [Glaciimonas immobilis]|uniref:Uncharacterized protein n=1 Tax=Glaciimonas immobilis TaxID=728004 RepID=A0A840RWF2_9BURK|nr:hypothetical protein [Glaciimonas immobilis]KAF3998646.1 hypothetical protein HAV38_07280 [Glaciimonas immobilis]MBB5201512.1 hypothetical protein [Glaciimonas immobilis]